MFAFARSAPVNLLRSESPCGRLRRKLPSETHPLVEHWALTARTGLRFSSSKNATMIGSCSSTYQLGQVPVFTESSRFMIGSQSVLPGQKAFRLEDPSHFMPRDSCEDNSVRSDLFALASALYGIEFGSLPLRTRMTRQLLSVLGRERFHRCRISC
ncbi:hypothetical protein KC344_g159 [Hortaea werneckii]|nr:hypothetical protein KC344_g159 [Hortaea werneckii]